MTLPPTRRVKDSRVFSSSLSKLEVEVFAVSLRLSRRRCRRRRVVVVWRFFFFLLEKERYEETGQVSCLWQGATPHRVTKSVKKHGNKNVNAAM